MSSHMVVTRIVVDLIVVIGYKELPSIAFSCSVLVILLTPQTPPQCRRATDAQLRVANSGGLVPAGANPEEEHGHEGNEHHHRVYEQDMSGQPVHRRHAGLPPRSTSSSATTLS